MVWLGYSWSGFEKHYVQTPLLITTNIWKLPQLLSFPDDTQYLWAF